MPSSKGSDNNRRLRSSKTGVTDVAKKCKKRKFKDKSKAERIAKYLTYKYGSKMKVYKCPKCNGTYYHLANHKEMSISDVKNNKRKFYKNEY